MVTLQILPHEDFLLRKLRSKWKSQFQPEAQTVHNE